MIWIIAYIISVPVCAFLMFALTANWYRSEHGNDELSIEDILYKDKYSMDKKRCTFIAFLPIINLTSTVVYFIIQVLSDEVKVSTPIDKLFRKLYRTKHLLNRVSEEV